MCSGSLPLTKNETFMISHSLLIRGSSYLSPRLQFLRKAGQGRLVFLGPIGEFLFCWGPTPTPLNRFYSPHIRQGQAVFYP